MNSPDAILTMFDKVETKKKLIQNNIPTPLILENIHDYQALRNQMQNQGISSVFIKPAHSSSASGVVAFRTNGKQIQAITPIELKQENETFSMYNVLNVRTYTDEKTVAILINNLLKSKICIEKWVPKASFNGSAFDFRVVVINGKARHIVARTSKSPITNLHLGNTRGDLSAIITRIGNTNFEAIKNTAQKTAACFPDCLYMGIDILITANLKKIMVLEVNAFGDLLPNLIDNGETIYQAQINASVQKCL
jgi:glutathione synthase/RimK-type ligase-like ATP-grasp enzyme